MRLSDHDRHVLRELTRDVFGADASVSLFGSRTDDARRGGDIDLLVECRRPIDSPVLRAARLEAKAQLALGEQRIDVLTLDPSTVLQPIHRAALREGQPL